MKTISRGTKLYNPICDNIEVYKKLKKETIEKNLDEIDNKLVLLVELNRKYGIDNYKRIRKNLVEQCRYWKKL